MKNEALHLNKSCNVEYVETLIRIIKSWYLIQEVFETMTFYFRSPHSFFLYSQALYYFQCDVLGYPIKMPVMCKPDGTYTVEPIAGDGGTLCPMTACSEAFGMPSVANADYPWVSNHFQSSFELKKGVMLQSLPN